MEFIVIKFVDAVIQKLWFLSMPMTMQEVV